MHSKTNNQLTRDQAGDSGIGVLIVFIAMVLVAAVAATVLITIAYDMQESAQTAGGEAVQQVSTGLNVISVKGDRSVEGKTVPAIVVASADTTAPSGGLVTSISINGGGAGVTEAQYGEITYSAPSDTGSGIATIEVHRIPNGAPALMDELTDLSASTLIDTIPVGTHPNGTMNGTYIDHGLAAFDGSGWDIYYALVAVDKAGNRGLIDRQDAADYYATEDGVSDERDVTAPKQPTNAANDVGESPSGDSIFINFTDVADDESADYSFMKYVRLYRSTAAMASVAEAEAGTLIAQWDRYHGENLGIDQYTSFGLEAIDFFRHEDFPPSANTWYYQVVTEDAAGNKAVGALVDEDATTTSADSTDPTGPEDVTVSAVTSGVQVTWTAGSDNSNFVRGYAVYRSTSPISDVASATSLQDGDGDGAVELYVGEMLGNSTYTFTDYSIQSGRTYYYAVAAIDGGGLIGVGGATLEATLQVLQLDVGLRAGSPEIDFDWPVLLEVSDGSTSVLLEYDSTVNSNFAENADADSYTAEIIRDTEGTWPSEHILSAGSIVRLYVDTSASGTGLVIGAQDSLTMRLIPKHGVPTLVRAQTPSAFVDRLIDLG